jgi:hypothetical protein
MNREDGLMLCLHRCDCYWWMDESGFRLLVDYLRHYYPKQEGPEDVFCNEILFAAINGTDLDNNRVLFKLNKFGKKALLLSFVHPAINAQEQSEQIAFEVCNKNARGVSVSKFKFFK